MMELSEADATSGGSVSDVRTIIVCNWQDCPFVADVTTCFAEAQRLTPRETEVLGLVVDGLDVGALRRAGHIRHRRCNSGEAGHLGGDGQGTLAPHL